jgi:hypothetical protein
MFIGVPFNYSNGERNLSVAIGPRTPGLAFKFVCTDADEFGGRKKADAAVLQRISDRRAQRAIWREARHDNGDDAAGVVGSALEAL